MTTIGNWKTIDDLKKAYEAAKKQSNTANKAFDEVVQATDKAAAKESTGKASSAAVGAWTNFVAAFTAAIMYLNTAEETTEARDLVEKIRNEATKAETAALEAVDLYNTKFP
jgi:hypothetical protein